MMNAVIFDNEIKIWWEYHRLLDGQSFCVIKDGVPFHTRKSHYNFTGLIENTSYSFALTVVDEKNATVEDLGAMTCVTKYAKKAIDVTKPPYNAVGDGKTLNTKAIQRALDNCKEDERVFLPDGIFLTGALDIKSDTELYLSVGAILQGTDDPEDYLPKIKSRFEGMEEMCYRSLLNTGNMDSKGGCNAENILIRGGKIFGGGDSLRKNIIAREREDILRAYGLEGEISPPHYYTITLPGRTRGRLLGACNTKNITVANTVIGNSASWNLHFIYCENVTTCGCTILSHDISNGDGWDPDSSKNCLLFDIDFDTGDDCVAIKSGKNLEGYEIARPCENISIFDCYSKEGHGIAIGSEMSGGIKKVFIWNCDIRYGTGFSLKTHKTRGGYIDDVRVHNCTFPTIEVGEYNGNSGGDAAPVEPTISNLYFEDIRLKGMLVCTGNTDRVVAENALQISGFSKENPVDGVTVKNLILKVRPFLPYQTLSFHNVKNLKVKNIIYKGDL